MSDSARKLTLFRLKSPTANHIKAKITINGKQYGAMSVDDSLSLNLPIGLYTVTIKVGGNAPLNMQISITDEDVDVYYKVSRTGTPALCDDDGEYLKDNNPTDSIVVDKKSKAGKVIGTILGTVALLFILMVVVGLVFGSDSSTSSAPAPNSSTSSKPVSNSVESQPVEETVKQEEVVSEPIFTPQTYTVGNWEITVNDFQYKDSISSGLLTEYTPEGNSKFCVISLTVKNIGNEMDVFLPLVSFDDETKVRVRWNGYEYTPSIDYLNPSSSLCSETLNPLVSTSGDLIFEVPMDVVDSEIAPLLDIQIDGAAAQCELVKY